MNCASPYEIGPRFQSAEEARDAGLDRTMWADRAVTSLQGIAYRGASIPRLVKRCSARGLLIGKRFVPLVACRFHCLRHDGPGLRIDLHFDNVRRSGLLDIE